MNKDIYLGKWKQMCVQIKMTWSRLSDDDLNKVGGNFEKFVGILQAKYEYSRERAVEEADRLVANYEG